MDTPTIQDKLTGTLRQVQSASLELVQIAAHTAAAAGVNENQVHDVLQACYRTIQQAQQQTQRTWQQSQQLQPQFSGPGFQTGSSSYSG